MAVIDKLVLHNFKSFKQSTIRFGKGFNCIVGPNGSGKSNICDSLLFALGETSLRRMRVLSSSQLISSMAKPNPEDKAKTARVSVSFLGQNPFEISRAVRSNKGISYRLDGNRADRQKIMDLLNANRCGIDETNTITQGEISRIISLNPKERRELIDVAAGIREFDDKKNAAIKELSKVEDKLGGAKIMLGEREGFLKELEAEKADAETYQQLSKTIRDTSYTILKAREKQLQEEHSKSLSALQAKSEFLKEVELSIESTRSRLAAASSERDALSKQLNERSMEANSINRQIDEVSKEVAVRKSQQATILERLDSIKGRTDILSVEVSEAKKKIASNEEEISFKRPKISDIEKMLGSYDTSDGEDHGPTDITEKYEANQAVMSEISREVERVSHDLAVCSASIEEQKRNTNANNEALSSIASEMASKGSEKLKLASDAEGLRAESSSISQKISQANVAITDIRSEIGKLDEELLRVREAIFASGGQDRIVNAIKPSIKTGFYGRVHDLMEYDEKHMMAINAAATSRLNYLVVDRIETAKSAITALKSKGLGRASFIPLEDIVVRQEIPPAQKTRMVPVISLVSFDKRYEKAFRYVFSNTYLVDSLEDAKKIGFGSYRFVTIDGNLVEPAGIITGGNIKPPILLSSLEKRLATMTSEKQRKMEAISVAEGKIESLKRELSNIEARRIANTMEAEMGMSYMGMLAERERSIKRAINDCETSMASLTQRHSELLKRLSDYGSKMDGLRSENSILYTKISSIVSNRGGAQGKVNKERLKALNSELNGLVASVASLSKENEILSQRLVVVASEMNQMEAERKSLKARQEEIGSEISSFAGKKSELEAKITGHGGKTTELYQKLSASEELLSRLGQDKGRLEAEAERSRRELMLLEGTIAQLQIRMGDIKAELPSYTDASEIKYASIKEMEDILAVSKANLSKMGNVNLKAPEMYGVRKEEADEAKQKILTLESEKNSILSMVEEIESKKLNVFNETFTAVNKNFEKLYGYIFDGSATLKLSSPHEPFSSGLLVNVRSGSGKAVTMETMSGGEKSLISLVLVFSIQMMSPKSFYIFDEIDSALDKENSKKLSKLIKELSAKSQFIVVSHNDALITAADTAIGITKQAGESKPVGIEMASRSVYN